MTTAAHNAQVLRAITTEVTTGEDAVDKPADAFIYGVVVGIMLDQSAPNSARDLRHYIEGIVGKDESPERVEVLIRGITDLFDQTADQKGAGVAR